MKKEVLLCGFNGKINSSKIVVDNVKIDSKIYLKNSFITSVNQLKKELTKNIYDYIILLGQKPDVKEIYIEIVGKYRTDLILTQYNYEKIANYFRELNYAIVISSDAGNYLCNNIYYNCLKLIRENNLYAKAIFLHIPALKIIKDIKKFSDDLSKYIEKINFD